MKPSDDLLFVPLGGSGEIGMNLNLYGYQDQWLMVDCGISFARDMGLDIIMPDISFIEKHRDALKGIILTHGHEDHIGALPYLWHRLKVPLYATPFTAFLIREKLKESGHLRHAKIHEIAPGKTLDLDPFKVQLINLTHSIPEPNALAIETPKGIVVHTGDWKIDPKPLVGKTTDIKKLKALGDQGVLALVCDSTNAFLPGRCGSEMQVRKNLIDLVQKREGRIIITCFASNVARFISAALAAQESGRRVALMGRSLFRMEEGARNAGYMKGVDPFLDESELKKYHPEETLLICTGSQGEPRSALSRMAMGTHPRIRLDHGDTVIFSSRMIPGNEAAIKEMQERLLERGVEVIQDHDETLHVSGHPARDDLKDMYDWVRPQILIPVHGENHHMREQALWGEACGIPQSFVPKNGDVIALNPQRLGLVDRVHHGVLALDGSTIVPLTSPHLKDRSSLTASGVVSLCIVRHKKDKTRVEAVHVALMGIAEPAMEETLKDILISALMQGLTPDVMMSHKPQEEARRIARRCVMQEKGRKPQVLVHFI